MKVSISITFQSKIIKLLLYVYTLQPINCFANLENIN